MLPRKEWVQWKRRNSQEWGGSRDGKPSLPLEGKNQAPVGSRKRAGSRMKGGNPE